MPTDDKGHFPAIYGDFVEVSSKANTVTLPPRRSTDHAIDLEPCYNLPYGRINNLSGFELRTVNAGIEVNLANGLIQWSSSLALAPIRFSMNKD